MQRCYHWPHTSGVLFSVCAVKRSKLYILYCLRTEICLSWILFFFQEICHFNLWGNVSFFLLNFMAFMLKSLSRCYHPLRHVRDAVEQGIDWLLWRTVWTASNCYFLAFQILIVFFFLPGFNQMRCSLCSVCVQKIRSWDFSIWEMWCNYS